MQTWHLRFERGDRLVWEGRGAEHRATVLRHTRSALYLRRDDGAGVFLTPGPFHSILSDVLDAGGKAYMVSGLRPEE